MARKKTGDVQETSSRTRTGGARKGAAKKKSTATRGAAAETGAKSGTPKGGGTKAAGAKKAGAVKLNERQTDLLRQIQGSGEGGYTLRQRVEQRTIDALSDRKLVKRGAKNKETGEYSYLLTKAGEKHLGSEGGGAGGGGGNAGGGTA